MYFDTHAHYDDPKFKKDQKELFDAMRRGGVDAIINCASDMKGCASTLKLVNEYDFVFGAVGVHPHAVKDLEEEDVYQLYNYACRSEKIVAIGEIGLDYYWESNPPKEFQQQVFRRQIELALELDLPVCIHDREAHGDSLAMVLEYPNLRGVFHCFSGSPEMAQELLKRGWYLGFDGPITYKNARRSPEVVAITPLERIVIETDAPYLTPVPFRGKRNDSRYLSYVVEKLAEWKGVSPEEMERVTWENGLRLYGLAGRV